MTLSALAHALALIGKTSEAQKVVDDLHTTAKQRYVSAYHIAEVYLGLGNKDLAYKWLDQAYENRDVELVWLRVSPVLSRFVLNAGSLT